MQLKSHDQRIKRLESLVVDVPIHKKKVVFGDKFAWHESANWDRVERGMINAQVEAILGNPTNTKTNIIDYVTLYYQGERSNSGFISGNVELNDDDMVLRVNRPIF